MTVIDAAPRRARRLGEMRVRDLMSPHPPRVLADSAVAVAHRALVATGDAHVIVVETDGTCDGVVSAATVDHAMAHCPDREGLTVSDLVLTRRLRLAPTATARDALQLMLEHRTDVAPVVDVRDRALGVVTWQDVAKAIVDRTGGRVPRQTPSRW